MPRLESRKMTRALEPALTAGSGLALAALIAGISVAGAADEPPAPPKHFAVEFRTGPKWDHRRPAGEQPGFKEHSELLQNLRQAGRLPLGARYGDKGLVIITGATAGEVAALFDGDPMVRDSIFVHEINEFAAFFPGTVGPPRPRAEPAPPPPSVTLPPELARVLTDYEKAWRARDAAGLAELFAEDGFVLSSHAPPVRGREAIRKHYARSGGPLYLRAFSWKVEGSVGFIQGGFATRPEAPDAGKFTLTLTRRGEGPWLIFSDMDNGNSPP